MHANVDAAPAHTSNDAHRTSSHHTALTDLLPGPQGSTTSQDNNPAVTAPELAHGSDMQERWQQYIKDSLQPAKAPFGDSNDHARLYLYSSEHEALEETAAMDITDYLLRSSERDERQAPHQVPSEDYILYRTLDQDLLDYFAF